MNLTEKPEVVTWPETHYVFIEKTGPFQTAAHQAWTEAHSHVSALTQKNQIVGYTSLYKVGPKIYRAGFALAAEPVDLPQGMQYEKFAGGNYSRFVLKGSYAQLGQASGRVWQIAEETKIPLRDDFAIENYLNNPSSTPEAELLTEILLPTA